MTFSGMDISRKQEGKRKRKLQGQEAVMMTTVKDRRNGLARPLLPGMTSPEPNSVGDMAWTRPLTKQVDRQMQRRITDRRPEPMKLFYAAGEQLHIAELRGSLVFWTLQIAVTKTSIHTDEPATALLYDIVNAVYTKMYFYGSCECVQLSKLYMLRQQTVQHTPVKLKVSYLTVQMCECICGNCVTWRGTRWHVVATEALIG